MELEAENWRTDELVVAENSRLCSTTVVRGVAGELEDENWRLCSTLKVSASRRFWRGCLSIFCVHSTPVFSVRFPAAVHAASPLTSSSHAHDDELGCHRLAAGGGLGGLRATSFISSDRSVLRDASGVAASAFSVFIPARFFP